MDEILPEQMAACLEVLQRVAERPSLVRGNARFNGLVSKVYKEARRNEQREERFQRQQQDRALQASTVMVQIQRDATSAAALPPPPTDASRRLHEPETCYVCKEPFVDLHFFYHLLCPKCAAYNYAMRDLHADLRGRTALVTGGRVKIGHQTVLRLLRDGARVIVTTRFPRAAAKRLSEEPDFSDWRERVSVCGLDLRNIPTVEAFAEYLLESEPALDILIHNAAQTVRRPRGFYTALMEQELAPRDTLAIPAQELVRLQAPSTLHVADSSALLPGVMEGVADVLPPDRLADNEERADSRNMNSWLLTLDQVGASEMLEVQLVNSVAPFLLNSRLKPLMVRSPFDRRFIVNVSAMEGQFRRHKTIFHPHTNMAKAALNMMTRTSGDDYARDGIYMNSVDTGWVTDENPGPKRERREGEGDFPPLDIVDGMARIYHPIALGINSPETPLSGQFLKDFAPCAW